MIQKKYYRLSIVILTMIGIALVIILPKKGMGSVWSVPYFSGAVNSEFGGEWLFDSEDVESFKNVNGWDIYFYDFEKKNVSELTPYSYNTSGFLYIVKLAHFIFPFLGVVGGVVLLQLLLHIFAVICLVNQLSSKVKKILFIVLYGINPLILYIVTFPFYYYWTILASGALIYLIVKPKLKIVDVLLTSVLITVSFVIRPTTLPIIIFTLFLLVRYKFYKNALISFIIIITSVFLFNLKLNRTKGYGPWHTAFIGIGAYPNSYSYLQKLSDDCGIERYESIRGGDISTSIKGNYYNHEVQLDYAQVMRNEYINVLRTNYFLIVRNFLLNSLQGYSIGHLSNRGLFANSMSLFLGLLSLVFFVIWTNWKITFSIFFSIVGVTIIYPPIPVYMFGTYVLIVFFTIRHFPDSIIKFSFTKFANRKRE